MKDVKGVLLGIIIGIVLLMFLVFGSKLIYEKPNYEDYCDYSRYLPMEKTQNDSEIQAQNNYYGECSKDYDVANEKYSRNMFLISLIVGVILITVSAIFIQINSISGGLMFGSLMFIVYGTGSYWKYMDDWGRFIILGIALGILIYVGYFLSKTGNKKGKNGRKN